MRIHLMVSRMTMEQADLLEYALGAEDAVGEVRVYDRTADAIIRYTGDRSAVIAAVAGFSYEKAAARDLVPEQTGRALNREYADKLVMTVVRRVLKKLFLPAPVRMVLTAFRAVKYIFKGIKALLRGQITVAVLDAAAIGVSLLRGDFDTAGSVIFMLRVGEILEEWTHKKAVDDLARSMSLNVDKVWLKTAEQEVLISIRDVQVGDEIVVRTGNMIPLDGKVVSGEASVNQASITGESIPVRKSPGSYVYAGTVVDEGSCVICVDKAMGAGRYDRIVKMIEQSERMKSSTESKAAHLADKLVPYSLGGTGLVYLLTRNVTRAVSVLMVDFSCALKLCIPIAVLSAMRECSGYGISVKGGRFMEVVAEADTVVLDKTGTITYATPRVADVVTFGGADADEALRLAACLEEHYPHSIANAVIAAAKAKNLNHEERHSQVEYVVAHGISSSIDGKKVIIGSQHFVFEDEGCTVPEGEREKFDRLPSQYSHLFLAVSGVLTAVICIEDPVRPEAAGAIARLHELGVSRVVMMTGDNERTAKAVADAVGVDAYFAGVLPEDKAAFIRREHQQGRKVIMIGDGVNDSPALSEADCGIAISAGAALAREIADITVSADDLFALARLKILSDLLMERVRQSYRFIMSFNTGLILLGALGILPPTTSALLHNASTLAISLRNMTDLEKQA